MRQHRVKRPDAAAVEGGAGFAHEQLQCARRRPGRAVDAIVGERVEDIRDREDRDPELQATRGWAVGVTAGVEALMMALDEPQDERREASELGEQLPAPGGVVADEGELVIAELRG